MQTSQSCHASSWLIGAKTHCIAVASARLARVNGLRCHANRLAFAPSEPLAQPFANDRTRTPVELARQI